MEDNDRENQKVRRQAKHAGCWFALARLIHWKIVGFESCLTLEVKLCQLGEKHLVDMSN